MPHHVFAPQHVQHRLVVALDVVLLLNHFVRHNVLVALVVVVENAVALPLAGDDHPLAAVGVFLIRLDAVDRHDLDAAIVRQLALQVRLDLFALLPLTLQPLLHRVHVQSVDRTEPGECTSPRPSQCA